MNQTIYDQPKVKLTQHTEGQNIVHADYIVQDNGDIITALSVPGGGNSTASEHMRSLLKGYNPRHYGYDGPLPINKKFQCWGRMWEIKQSTLGIQAGLGLFAAEDIVLRETRGGKVTNANLFPYSGPVYRALDWEMVVHEWPQIKPYSLLSSYSSSSHHTRGEYIDGTPSYTWCIAAYMNSSIHQPAITNVLWEESYTRSPRIHVDTKLPHVWTVALRTIKKGEELFSNYPIYRM